MDLIDQVLVKLAADRDENDRKDSKGKNKDDNESRERLPQQLGVQSYLPILNKRELAPEEEDSLERSSSRVLPTIFQNYGTPVHEMAASPNWSALLAGGLGGTLGALGGAGLGGSVLGAVGPEAGLAGAGLGGALGALGGAGLGGLVGYYGRQAHNDGVREMMQRLPHNATMRDYYSDPVVNADIDRGMARGQQYGQSSGALLAALAAAGRGMR